VKPTFRRIDIGMKYFNCQRDVKYFICHRDVDFYFRILSKRNDIIALCKKLFIIS